MADSSLSFRKLMAVASHYKDESEDKIKLKYERKDASKSKASGSVKQGSKVTDAILKFKALKAEEERKRQLEKKKNREKLMQARIDKNGGVITREIAETFGLPFQAKLHGADAKVDRSALANIPGGKPFKLPEEELARRKKKAAEREHMEQREQNRHAPGPSKHLDSRGRYGSQSSHSKHEKEKDSEKSKLPKKPQPKPMDFHALLQIADKVKNDSTPLERSRRIDQNSIASKPKPKDFEPSTRGLYSAPKRKKQVVEAPYKPRVSRTPSPLSSSPPDSSEDDAPPPPVKKQTLPPPKHASTIHHAVHESAKIHNKQQPGGPTKSILHSKDKSFHQHHSDSNKVSKQYHPQSQSSCKPPTAITSYNNVPSCPAPTRSKIQKSSSSSSVSNGVPATSGKHQSRHPSKSDVSSNHKVIKDKMVPSKSSMDKTGTTAEADPPPPDYIVVNGVKYYAAGVAPAQPAAKHDRGQAEHRAQKASKHRDSVGPSPASSGKFDDRPKKQQSSCKIVPPAKSQDIPLTKTNKTPSFSKVSASHSGSKHMLSNGTTSHKSSKSTYSTNGHASDASKHKSSTKHPSAVKTSKPHPMPADKRPPSSKHAARAPPQAPAWLASPGIGASDFKRQLYEQYYNEYEHAEAAYDSEADFEDEEEEEDDSDMADFIDDTVDADDEYDKTYSKHISEIFKYDKSKYKDRPDDTRGMEASYRDIQREEMHSQRIAVKEDMEEMKREQDALKRKAERAALTVAACQVGKVKKKK